MDYWELRKLVSKIVPGMTQLFIEKQKVDAVREKGRKKNYHQFNLLHNEWRKQERLLNTEEINSFLEISVRAAACPMPYNMDIWDGLLCVVAGQNVTTKRGDIPIENIQEGDEVLTMNENTHQLEWKPVLSKSTTIKNKFIEIETEIGKIQLTEDHKVYTQRGWIEAKELTNEDEMFSY